MRAVRYIVHLSCVFDLVHFHTIVNTWAKWYSSSFWAYRYSKVRQSLIIPTAKYTFYFVSRAQEMCV